MMNSSPPPFPARPTEDDDVCMSLLQANYLFLLELSARELAELSFRLRRYIHPSRCQKAVPLGG